jgi:hypothetical protein
MYHFSDDCSLPKPIYRDDLTERITSPASADITQLQHGLVLRANSVLITVYGDVMAQRGQALWLAACRT